MRKNKLHIIPILIAVITIISVIPANAMEIPKESIPDNTPQAAIDIAEHYINVTLIKVRNGLGYADAKNETNRILFNAFLKNETGGYGYGLLTIIANNAIFEYRDLYLRPEKNAAYEEQVKILLADLIAAVENGTLYTYRQRYVVSEKKNCLVYFDEGVTSVAPFLHINRLCWI